MWVMRQITRLSTRIRSKAALHISIITLLQTKTTIINWLSVTKNGQELTKNTRCVVSNISDFRLLWRNNVTTSIRYCVLLFVPLPSASLVSTTPRTRPSLTPLPSSVGTTDACLTSLSSNPRRLPRLFACIKSRPRANKTRTPQSTPFVLSVDVVSTV